MLRGCGVVGAARAAEADVADALAAEGVLRGAFEAGEDGSQGGCVVGGGLV